VSLGPHFDTIDIGGAGDGGYGDGNKLQVKGDTC
jgi:hypothetical protein